MEVSSLYTNIPPPPIPKRLLEKAPKLTLKENPSQLNGQSYLQTHGRGIGTKTAVALANIFMAKIEMQVLDKGARLESLHRRHNLSLAHQQICRQPFHWTSE